MTDLDRVAQPAPAANVETGAVLHPAVVAARQLERCLGVVRQQAEEGIETVGIEALPGRKLPQHRTELGAELEHPRGEKVGQRDVDILEPLHVRDETRALDREDKAIGRLGMPVAPRLRPLQ